MCLHLSFSSQICTHTLSHVPPTGLSTPPKAPHTHILRSCQEWLHATVCFHTKRPFLVTFRRAGASPLCSSSPSTQNMSRSQLILRNYTVRLPKIQGETECSYGAPLAYPMSLRKVTGPALPGSHPPCAWRLVEVPPARDHYQIKRTPPRHRAADATRRRRPRQTTQLILNSL